MKRTIAFIIAMMISAGALASCGDSDQPEVQSGKVDITLAQDDQRADDTDDAPAETDAEETSETVESAEVTTAPEADKPEVSETETTEATEPIDAVTEAKVTSEATTTTTTAATTTTTTTTTTTITVTTKAPAGYSDADAAVVYGGITVTLDADFSSAKAALGNPDSKQENPNCITGSNGYTYIYGGLTVNIYVKGDKEYAEAIMIDSGNAKTSKGIAIGSSTSDMTGVYGKAADGNDYVSEYKGNNTSLIFYTEGGKVTGIFMTINY